MESPLEVVPLDNDRCGDLPVASSLELRSDVDKESAV